MRYYIIVEGSKTYVTLKRITDGTGKISTYVNADSIHHEFQIGDIVEHIESSAIGTVRSVDLERDMVILEFESSLCPFKSKELRLI